MQVHARSNHPRTLRKLRSLREETNFPRVLRFTGLVALREVL